MYLALNALGKKLSSEVIQEIYMLIRLFQINLLSYYILKSMPTIIPKYLNLFIINIPVVKINQIIQKIKNLKTMKINHLDFLSMTNKSTI